ncbi:phosphoribosylanthranilate isomerase [Sediminibacillus dalangtanensis]|uniref:phosphoribosylanthranilate isomerase n=1 Tax=Sediminibacillus dalangtanensis TaxID=2729421 RepID=UPI001FD780DE|nr:phosphoribosylanthranilate isomerase [Sediminibacillus dalangtanensis]
MQVKICGITTIEAAEAAVNAGADFIGFVFAPSKRRVSVEQARSIAEKLPAEVKKVGVFVNEQAETIGEIAEQVGLDYVQLHGDESPELVKSLEVPVIKAFQITSTADLKKLTLYQCDYFLLDSPAGKYRGGNGEVFDWSLTKELPALNGKLILAGGLHADNVREAIEEVTPNAVDVSSGVETAGRKDEKKIYTFIQAAKSTGEEG